MSRGVCQEGQSKGTSPMLSFSSRFLSFPRFSPLLIFSLSRDIPFNPPLATLYATELNNYFSSIEISSKMVQTLGKNAFIVDMHYARGWRGLKLQGTWCEWDENCDQFTLVDSWYMNLLRHAIRWSFSGKPLISTKLWMTFIRVSALPFWGHYRGNNQCSQCCLLIQ